MGNIRAVIVDDSVFTIAVIRNILEDNGIEVVGSAGSLEEVKQVVKDTKPSLVTMDMTLPGTDGLACTRAIKEIDENIKVIIISSMMDDEIIGKAKKSRASAYLQKPIDANELITTINRVMAGGELYEYLQQEYAAVFKEALLDGVNKMTKTLLQYRDEFSSTAEYESAGMSVIVGISGRFAGRMLIDLSKDTAQKIAAAIFRRDSVNNDEMVATLAEFANIIAGNTCSILNRKNAAFGLRVAPPTVLSGDSVLISTPNFRTTSAYAETAFGEILLNAGFNKGDDEWTQSM